MLRLQDNLTRYLEAPAVVVTTDVGCDEDPRARVTKMPAPHLQLALTCSVVVYYHIIVCRAQNKIVVDYSDSLER